MYINWANKEINVLKSDMVLTQSVPSEIYRLDLDVFRLDLKNIEDSSDGMAFPRTHSHNQPVTVGGAVLARVIEIKNGYTVRFEDGQYRVETIGANSNIGAVVQVNQVSVSTSNSAGLQDLNSLQAASFGGGIAVDVNSNYTGIAFPVGTRAQPVNNLADAISIANKRGIRVIYVASNLTLTNEDASVGFEFIGNSAVINSLTIEDAANIENCTFRNLTIQGVLDNGNILRECNILDVTHNNGYIHQCALSGVITLGGGAQSTIMDCYSGFAGSALTATIDLGGSGSPLVLRGYSGGIKLINRTGTDGVSIDMASGQVIIDETVTDGEITVRGTCTLINNGTGTSSVETSGLLNKEEINALTPGTFMALKG